MPTLIQYTAKNGEIVMKPPSAASPLQGFDPAIKALWFGYLCFVIYGSLVPLDFKLIPLDQALTRFSQISLLDVGTAGRADWVANGILFAPVGFLTALTFQSRSTGWLSGAIAAVGASCFSLALAVGIEFAQLFFPPRTVSLNDLLAEAVGATVGVLLALLGGRFLRTLLANVADATRLSGKWLLWAYALLYLAFSFFPLDFVLSVSELQEKVASKSWGWWMAQSFRAEARWSYFAMLLAETLMAVPIGLLLATILRIHSGRRWMIASVTGLGVGLVIELLQFLLISGVSQGMSVVARVGGFYIGMWTFGRTHLVNSNGIQVAIRRYALLLVSLYLPMLAGVSGWFSSPWRGSAEAARRLTTEVNFTPFFYHYFTTEAHALFSLGAVSLLYTPVGLLAWAYRWPPLVAMLMASLLAAVVEVGKLFPASARPDPTNIWIAGAIAGAAVVALRLWAARDAPSASEKIALDFSAVQRVLLLAIVIGLMAIWLTDFPSYRLLLGACFVVYVVALWRNPLLQFIAVPASLPLLDLAPFSGRFFLDEFDWLIIVGLAIGYVRIAPSPSRGVRWRIVGALAIAVMATFAIGSWRALTPLQWPDVNAFNTYLSPFNALRVAKGALWAVLALPLIIRAQTAGEDVHLRFGIGMVVGLIGTVLFVLWERASFATLMDFSYPYRVSGPISAMHIGGAYLECYLTVAIAFLIGFLTQVNSKRLLVLGGLLLAASVYAVMVTYSRGGYFALLLVGTLMLLANLRRTQARRQTIAIASMLIGVAVVAAVPVLRGEFAQSRLASVERDLGVRDLHWRAAIALRNADWQSEWLGMGVGQFPVARYLGSDPAERSAAYQLVNESGNLSLRLGAGRPLFIDQVVSVHPNTDYLLKLRTRAKTSGDTAIVYVCHKWQLASTDCRELRFSAPGANNWLRVEQPFNSGALGGDPWYSRRTVKLTLQSGGGGEIEMDDVQLISPTGEDLLRNGNFNRGLDNWNFTSDEHLAWHIKQMALAVLFDQGVFGLAVMGLLVTLAFARASYGAWRGNLAQTTTLAALSAFIAVGLFDSLIDSPRFLFLFVAICWLALTIQLPVRVRRLGNRTSPT